MTVPDDRLDLLLAEMRGQRAELAELRSLVGAPRVGAQRVPAPATPGVVSADQLTLADIWPIYELAEKRDLDDWRSEEGRWRLHISQPFGQSGALMCFATMPAMQISALHIDMYRAHRLDEWTEKTKDFDETKRKKKTAPATVNREVARIRRLLYFAVERGLIPYSPLAGLKAGVLIKEEKNVRQTVVEEFHPEAQFTIFDLVKHATPVMRAAIWMSHGTGMRRDEVARARWERLDLRTGVLFIPGVETKGDTGGREVVLRAEAIEAIQALPRDFRFKSGYLIANPNTGKQYHKDYFTKGFRETCRRAGITGPDGSVWFHDLRRSFATLTRRRGEDTSSIMNQGGWRTPSVFKRYNIFSRKDLLAAARRQREARELERSEFENLRRELGDRRGAHASRSQTPTHNSNSTQNNAVNKKQR